MKLTKAIAALLLSILTFTACDVNITVPAIPSVGGTVKPSDSDDTTPDNGGNGEGTEDTDTPDGGNEEPPADYNNDDITFDKGERSYIIVGSETADYAYKVQQILESSTDTPAFAMTDSSTPNTNEFVFGKCSREISKEAYSRLEAQERAHSYVARFVIYSTGNSVALAFDKVTGYENHIINYAIDMFRAKYVTEGEPINLPEGEYYTEQIDFIAYQEEIDARAEAKAWDDFEKAAGSEAASALKTMYETIYSGGLVEWLAGIYDTETGGFYFANSTRDNEKTYINGAYYDLLPDIESTDQALEFIRMSGMTGGESLLNALPEWIRLKIIKFVKERQDPSGYFYHPQWTHAMVDNELSRRGRDLSKAISTLTQLGAKPTYTTPTGIAGDGKLWDGTPVSKVALTMPMSISKINAVSLVIPTAAAAYPSHMENKAAFESYLASLNDKMASDPYWVGNQLASQADQIKARDLDLKESGANYSLALILKDWLDSKCYSTTGHWSQKADYPGLNGFLKISATYQSLGLELPYPEAAARSAVDSIELSGRYPTACFAYNSWMSVSIIINNVNKHKSPEEAERIVNSIRAELHERAPELIEVTMRKQGAFLVEDGSFMYIESGSSGTSQNLPISIPGTIEGTMNSTLLCTTGTVSHMMAAFGYPTVPLLYRSDLNRFISILEDGTAENN